MRRSRLVRMLGAAVGLAVGSVSLGACVGGSSPTTITATFSNAEGLFPGNTVDSLGVPIGQVTKVTPVGDQVVVTMAVDPAKSLPADVHAALTDPQLLGEPTVELSPGYSGGPKLASGAAIPLTRTSVPESTDQLLKDLQTFLGEVHPQTVGSLVANLATDLQGQGAALNNLIAQGAGTLQTLAQKGNDLGQLNGSLASITRTLRQRSATVAQLLQQYDTVSGVLAQNAGPLGDAVQQLAQANAQISSVLAPNLAPLQGDISTITQVGRTLDRNLGNLDQGLSSAVALFNATGKAVDPSYNWLNLNNQIPAGTTSAYVASMLRDRLAGVCRRVLANHAQGLSASAITTLQTCGNPNSGFFDQLLSVIPNVLGQLTGTGAPNPPSAQQVLSQGLAQIPGVSSAQSQQLSSIPPSQLGGSSAQGTSLDSGATLPPMSNSNTSSSLSSGGGLLGGLLNGLAGTVHFCWRIW
ncbi:MAG TPA: MCE family protein [Acidimicrobiales bacterium]|nr:MCE family protein [Acidimicrobiales bacterium]